MHSSTGMQPAAMAELMRDETHLARGRGRGRVRARTRVRFGARVRVKVRDR